MPFESTLPPPPSTDVARFNGLTWYAKVAYLAAIPKLNSERALYASDAIDVGHAISYGNLIFEEQFMEAIVREWIDAGLITVPDEDENGLRRIAFEDHELIRGGVI